MQKLRLVSTPPPKRDRRVDQTLRKRLETLVLFRRGDEDFFKKLQDIAKDKNYEALEGMGLSGLSPEAVVSLLRLLSANRKQIISVVAEPEVLPKNYEDVFIDACYECNKGRKNRKKMLLRIEAASLGNISGKEFTEGCPEDFSEDCKDWKPGHFEKLLKALME